MTKESLILDGKKVANDLKHCLKNKINQISEKAGKRPKLAVILVGDLGEVFGDLGTDSKSISISFSFSFILLTKKKPPKS